MIKKEAFRQVDEPGASKPSKIIFDPDEATEEDLDDIVERLNDKAAPDTAA